MKFESVLKKNLFYVLLVVALIWIAAKGTSFSAIGSVPENNINYPAETATYTFNCAWTGSVGSTTLNVHNIPAGVSINTLTSFVRSTIVSVSSSVNNMWVGSTGTSGISLAVQPSGDVWVGGFGNLGAIALQRDTNIDGTCQLDYTIKYIQPIISLPIPTPTVIFPSTPMPTPTPEIIIQPVPVPPVSTPMPPPVTKWYISNGQCVSTTTPSLVSASLYTSFGQCENARGATDITVYIGILVIAILGFLVLKKMKAL